MGMARGGTGLASAMKCAVDETTGAIKPDQNIRDEYQPGIEITKGEPVDQRTVSIIAQAAFKSTLESPTVAMLASMRPESEVPALIESYTRQGVKLVLKIMAEQGK